MLSAANIPWKATGGYTLCPIRHFDSGLQAIYALVFDYDFAAGILAHAQKIKGAQLEKILCDEAVSHFSVSENLIFG